MSFLLDTHIWLWYLHESDSLPSTLRRAIARAPGSQWVSPISIWEVALLHRRGRFDLGVPLREWVSRALNHFPVHEASITNEVAIVSEEIDLPHRDPADRFLAATALVYDLTLMTVDPRLIDAPGIPTRSA